MTSEQDKFCDNNCVWTDHHPDCKLSQKEPEWYHVIDVHGCNRFYHKTEDCPYEFRTPLYTTPPQRTAAKGEDSKAWVGLTDDEKFEVADCSDSFEDVVDAVETKLKAKNERLEKNT